ncbi:VOC family protein [Ochrobactrum sp. GPK 3]|uniref:VOC family protein n=1 Tax=Brucella/Ochrobactrum group TaxID=2826938 RepID=UPI0009921FB6|nr:catechol 2,3-dioxygenase-like lactoylglutathione lyase family enzyme [Ochrobactrum sp. P6BSIII]OOL15742.1 glyoxalase [Ochrobactrum sp. P6BS-III]
MRFSDRYPIIVTAKKDEARDFWLKYLQFDVTFDSQWFCLLVAENGSASIAFMTPDHPSSPPGPESFTGTGLCFEMEVADATAAHAELIARGLPVTYPLTNEPFGQRRFGFEDPSGLWIDVVEQTEPQAGFWDKYMM